jgi:cytochrome c2
VSDRDRWAAAAALGIALLTGLGLSACNNEARIREQAVEMTGGYPEQGALLIRKYGCSSCHVIPGIEGARGMIGPPLNGIAARTYLGGQLPNTPQNMMRWIRDPQGVERGTAMPNVGVSEPEARHIAAYLYTLR